jgi:hypothetical protein
VTIELSIRRERRQMSEAMAELGKFGVGRTDWLAAAAGDAELAEELRTGVCQCGVPLAEDAPPGECRRHERGREKVAGALRSAWTGASLGTGPRGEDLELLGRYLPAGFLFAYEVLILRGSVLNLGLRGGRGYDEGRDVRSGRRRGGLGSARSGEPELRLTASPPSRRGGSRDLVRDEVALAKRKSVDRKLRKLGREMLTFLEGVEKSRTVRRCTGKKCRQFAEEDWIYCPRCASPVEEIDRGQRT